MKNILASLIIMLAMVTAGMAQNRAAGIINASSTDCATTNSCVILNMSTNSGVVAIQVNGTFSATLLFETTVNGSTWIAPTSGDTSTTTAGIWQISSAGYTGVRVRAFPYTSGVANVTLQASTASTGGISGGTVTTSCSTADCATRIYYSDGTEITSSDVVPVQGSTGVGSSWSGNPVVFGAASGGNVANLSVAPGTGGLLVAPAGYTAAVSVGSSVTALGANITDHVVGPTVAAGDRIVVLGYKYICAPTVTVNVTFSIGFGAASVPASGNGLFADDDITEANTRSGIAENFSVPQPGAAGEEVRLTSTAPTGGTCSVGLRYYTEDAP